MSFCVLRQHPYLEFNLVALMENILVTEHFKLLFFALGWRTSLFQLSIAPCICFYLLSDCVKSSKAKVPSLSARPPPTSIIYCHVLCSRHPM